MTKYRMILNLTDEQVDQLTRLAGRFSGPDLEEAVLRGAVEQTIDEFRSCAVEEEDTDPGEPDGNAGWDYERTD